MNDYTSHVSVLKDECLRFLTENISSQSEPKLNFADLTFGGGGHSCAILNTDERIHLFSTDQDPEALANGYALLSSQNLKERCELLAMNFSDFPEYMNKTYPEKKLKGILMDLGVSSHHFDKGDRGFSFRFEAALDMRMNHHDDTIMTAADLINDLPEEKIANLIYEYGEDRLSRVIARKIVEARKTKRIETTKELENICFHAYPAKQRHGGAHPATRTFQALRIAVNQELHILTDVIPRLIPLLDEGGRLAIISFHSLEDRIIKVAFKEAALRDEVLLLTKKPIGPTEDEIKNNFRSRSAKLRVIEKR